MDGFLDRGSSPLSSTQKPLFIRVLELDFILLIKHIEVKKNSITRVLFLYIIAVKSAFTMLI